MAGPLEAAGALPEPSEYATLSMDRHLTGLWTQRSPLRDADVPYLYGKFYSASRFDSLIDGVNREITARLTDARRPGSSVYNSNTFPAMHSFYGYRYVRSGEEIIRVFGDGKDGAVYEVTAGQKALYLNKSSGAGKARFLTVNNNLYIADGVDFLKVVASPIVWTANTPYQVGQWIDSGTGAGLQVITTAGTSGSSQPTFSGTFGATTADGTAVWTCKGNPTQPWQIPGPVYAPTVTATGIGPGTATASPRVGANATPPNASSASQWAITANVVGSEWVSQWASGIFHSYWLNMTSPGFAIPAAANIASIQVTVSFNIQGPWPSGVTSNLPQLWIGFLKNGAQYGPSFYESSIASGVAGSRTFTQTVDGVNVAWTPEDLNATGFGVYFAWANGADSPHPPFGDRFITVTAVSITVGYGGANTGTWRYGFSYSNSITADETTGSPLSSPVTMLQGGYIAVSGPGSPNPQWDTVNVYRTAQDQPTPLFLASLTNPGTGATWTFNDMGTPDSALLAQRAMLQNHEGDPPPPGFTAPEYHAGRIWGIVGNAVVYSQPLSTNGFAPLNFIPLQGELPIRLFAGVSSQGSTLFVWGTANIYAIFGDGTDSNPFTPATKYMSSVGILSYDCVTPVGSTYYALTSKRKFVSLDPGAGYVEAGFPIGDQFKRVTTGAGVPGPAPFSWNIENISYEPATSTITVPHVIIFPPNIALPAGTTVELKGLTAHPECNGPAAVIEATPSVLILVPPPALEGQPFFSNIPETGTVSTLPTPATGALYDPSSAYVTWNEAESGDTGLYVADGNIGWFRFSPVASPESGYLWSPRAIIAGGTSAVQSIEIAPGVARLLIAPQWSGKILMRDSEVHGDWNDTSPVSVLLSSVQGILNPNGSETLAVTCASMPFVAGQTVDFGGLTNASWLNRQTATISSINGTTFYSQAGSWVDNPATPEFPYGPTSDTGGVGLNYQPYPSWDVKGNIVLCQSGQVAEIAHIGLKSMAVGARPIVSLLLGEVSPTQQTPFDPLEITSTDPPDLPPPETMYSDRYSALQNGVCPKCDNFQLRVDYGSQNAPDELLMYEVYGAKHAERRQQ